MAIGANVSAHIAATQSDTRLGSDPRFTDVCMGIIFSMLTALGESSLRPMRWPLQVVACPNVARGMHIRHASNPPQSTPLGRAKTARSVAADTLSNLPWNEGISA